MSSIRDSAKKSSVKIQRNPLLSFFEVQKWQGRLMKLREEGNLFLETVVLEVYNF